MHRVLLLLTLAACTSEEIYASSAKDLEKAHDIAFRAGAKMDACVIAGTVAASYLQAHEEVHYKMWKDVEQRDCKAAGVHVSR